jgi:hypothetical protein
MSRSLCPLRLSSACVDDAVIHVYDKAGNVIETQEHAGVFKEWLTIRSGLERVLSAP